jgi:DNA-binding NtrC family response regulator
MPHLLIVEDEPSMSWALSEGLADDGFTIDTFPTAEAALRWLRRGHSDLVITDLRLPGMSGLELAQRLSSRRRPQPVILVSAYAATGGADQLSRAGIVASFPKPFEMDALRRAVWHALSSAAARPARKPRRKAA